MDDTQQFTLTMALFFLSLFVLLLLTPWGRQGFVNLLLNIRYLFTGRRSGQ